MYIVEEFENSGPIKDAPLRGLKTSISRLTASTTEETNMDSFLTLYSQGILCRRRQG